MEKKILHVIISFILPFLSHAQEWSWETNLPNGSIADMKSLPSGISYITGFFPNIQPKDSASTADYFLLKIDSSGNIISGIKKAPLLLQTGLHVGSDHEGNIYVAGTPFSPQANNYYLQKYNASGLLIWGIKFFIDGNISAMDVNYGRVALTGNYKKVLQVYGTDGVTVKRTLGQICNPDYEYPCSFKSDVFVANFNEDGTLVWAEKYYSQMQSGYVQDENYYFTKKDYDDFGLDISIEKNQNILLVAAFSPHDSEPASKAVIAGRVIDVNIQDNYPPTLIKLSQYGEYMWSFNETNGILYTEAKKRVDTDKNGNVFTLYEHMHETEGLFLKVNKRNTTGQIEWGRNVKANDPATFDLLGWSWHLDSLGNSYVVGRFTDWGSEDECNLVSFDKNNNLIKDYGTNSRFNSKELGIDADLNLYFSKVTTISKYISQNPKSYEFTGNGMWSNVINWKDQVKPEKELRKWDTIYISTSEGDSCMLDVFQAILTGAIFKVQDGSRFIVPGTIQTAPLPQDSTPLVVTASSITSGTPGEKVHVSISVIRGEYPLSTGILSTVDLTSIGGTLYAPLNDEGTMGDLTAGDLNFGLDFILPDTVSPGQKIISYKIQDAQARGDSGSMILIISKVKGSSLVISQVYGGGGLSGSSYRNDYVEIFNRGNTPIDLSGKSLQYASASGIDTFGQIPPVLLSGLLQPGQYYLIRLWGSNSGKPLPLSPDKTDTLNISETNGKLVIVNSALPLGCNGQSTPCNDSQLAQIIDLVGYGNANFFEGTPAPVIQNGKVSSLMRHWDGCGDSDNNLNDFYISPTLPRNTLNPVNICKPKIVISQVFSRAGQINAGPYFDFIELYNAGSKAQSINGWSVQYADSLSDNWQSTPLWGTVQPGKYYLVRQGFNPNGTSYLPPPDAYGNINFHGSAGKVALVMHNLPITGQCPTDSIADFLGYGTANCFEGTSTFTTTPTGILAFLRKENGCIDNNDNKTDFLTSLPNARNSASPLASCLNYTNQSLFIDSRDGKLYPIKRYGEYVWMTMNMDYKPSNPIGPNYSVYYDNDSANGPIFGRLYTWDAAMQACPTGWHLPSSFEWSVLITAAGGGGAMKDTAYWEVPNTGATNISKFNARPGGTWDGVFENKGYNGYWWTSTYHTSTGVIHWADVYTLSWNSVQVSKREDDIGEIYSVRCVKN